MPERKDLSLYDELSARGYEASVVATFNTRFSLYERVLLRRLQAVGCRYNLLLADAGQCGMSLAQGEDLPECAGAEYGLLPIRAAGAFHPKFVLLLGRTKARLIVGSHNVSVGGFGFNREISTAFDIDPTGPSAALGRNVWRFVRAWASDLPDEVAELITVVHHIAPWLEQTREEPGEDVLLWTGPDRPSLWEQVHPLLGRPIAGVSVLSPYFDSNCAFIKRVVRDLHPRELAIGIDPESSEFPPSSRRLLPDARFLDVSSLGEGWRKRLHAKIYRFEFRDGGSVVVSGSANASRAAWLWKGEAGNAEMVVVHRNGDQVWKSLGLTRFSCLPEVSADRWRDMKDRQAVTVDDADHGEAALYHAVVQSDGFEVSAEFVGGSKLMAVDVLAGSDLLLQISPEASRGSQVLCRTDDSTVRDEATLLRVTPARGRQRFAILSRVDDLCDKAAGTLRQSFRRALSGLQGDPEQITELLKVVEKAIFDQAHPLPEAEGRSGKPSQEGKGGSREESEPASLMISAGDTVKSRRKRRLAPSSDLAVIIDALIYKLGQGLRRGDTDSVASIQSREPAPGDEDDDEDNKPEPAVIAKLCRTKVNHLFKRMLQQFDAANERGTHVTSAIVQLAAVLGIVKHLRTGHFVWLPKNESLVDLDKSWSFFKNACRSLHAPSMNLAGKALEENAGREFDELTIVRGLLAWLAFECEVNVETLASDIKEDPDDAREYLLGVACLLPVAAACARDPHAAALLGDALSASPSEVASAERHLTWAKRVETAAAAITGPAPGPLKVGDIVVPFKAMSRQPFVVSEVLHGKTGVVDLDRLEHKYFVDGWLASIQLDAASSAPGARAPR